MALPLRPLQLLYICFSLFFLLAQMVPMLRGSVSAVAMASEAWMGGATWSFRRLALPGITQACVAGQGTPPATHLLWSGGKFRWCH